MRTIEFRGKSNDRGKWIIGSLRIDPDTVSAFISNFKYSIDEDRWKREWFEEPVRVDTVGQYTGIDDMNKNRIFEGDIVRAFIPKDEAENEYTLVKGYVFFEKGSFCIKEDMISPPLINVAPTPGQNIRIEIIGNVYDGVKQDETKEN